jgi:hypothetical protein
MTYTPTPYAQAKDVPAAQLRRYLDIDVTLELPNPADEDADWIEHEFSMFYQVGGAEPDVGIMSDYVDDWFYANADGTKLSEELWSATDKIDHREGAYNTPHVDPAIQRWHERNLEAAMESSLPY